MKWQLVCLFLGTGIQDNKVPASFASRWTILLPDIYDCRRKQCRYSDRRHSADAK